jgi:hypothetical protein
LKATLFFIILAIVQTITAAAQSNLYFLSATTGAACQQLELNGNYLYSGTGSTLRVYDVSSGIPPFPILFEYRCRSFITDLKVHGNNLFVAANHDGIYKWDLENPAHPALTWNYMPQEDGEATHDLSFFNDTIISASNKMIIMVKDLGTDFQRIGSFGLISGNGFISGGDVKGNLFAYTVGRNDAGDGVYIINLLNLNQLSYFPQTFCDPENVIFGKNNNLLHVLGGTQNYSNPFDSRGLFYSLDITNVSEPVEVFRDTIEGFIGLAIANARNAVNINDTLYVVTTAGLGPDWVFPDPAFGQVYVYDAVSPQDIHFLTSLYAGLWYFDIAVNPPDLYVASEWYGIKTLDISNLFDEVDLGNTPTGGWAMKADVHGDRLVLANEGYGIKLFDISDHLAPVLLNVNNDEGFCQDVKFSDDGNFIYAVYQTFEPFRVYDTHTLQRSGDLSTLGGAVGYGFSRMVVHGNFIYLDHLEGNQQRLKVINIINPEEPVMLGSLQTDVMDMELNQDEVLFICNDDSLEVFSLAGDGMEFLTGISYPGIQDGKELAVFKDTVFVYVTMKGLVRYHLINGFGGWLLEENSVITLPEGTPQAMAADSMGLYIGHTLYGLKAYDRNSLQEIAYYQTGLDYKGFADVWPLTDLFCKDGYLFLTEYFSQTSILTSDPFLNDIPVPPGLPDENLVIFPNPSSGEITVSFTDQVAGKKFRIFDLSGRLVKEGFTTARITRLGLENLLAGIYFLQIDSTPVLTAKFIIK